LLVMRDPPLLFFFPFVVVSVPLCPPPKSWGRGRGVTFEAGFGLARGCSRTWPSFTLAVIPLVVLLRAVWWVGLNGLVVFIFAEPWKEGALAFFPCIIWVRVPVRLGGGVVLTPPGGCKFFFRTPPNRCSMGGWKGLTL